MGAIASRPWNRRVVAFGIDESGAGPIRLSEIARPRATPVASAPSLCHARPGRALFVSLKTVRVARVGVVTNRALCARSGRCFTSDRAGADALRQGLAERCRRPARRPVWVYVKSCRAICR